MRRTRTRTRRIEGGGAEKVQVMQPHSAVLQWSGRSTSEASGIKLPLLFLLLTLLVKPTEVSSTKSQLFLPTAAESPGCFNFLPELLLFASQQVTDEKGKKTSK